MKRSFTFLFAAAVMLFTMMLPAGAAWGQTGSEQSIGISSSGVSLTNDFQSGTIVKNGITFGYTDWKNELIAKASTQNSFYNVDEIPGVITRVIVNQRGSATITMFGGSSLQHSVNAISPTPNAYGTSTSFDFSGNEYTYFSMATGENDVTLVSLFVYYDPLVSIEVTGTPLPLWTGDPFSHQGITVWAHWWDGSTTDISSVATFSGYDMSQPGDQTVTVSYGSKSTTYTVHLNTIANTQATAYTVAQAKALIDAGIGLNQEVYVHGKVTQRNGYSNGTYTYRISDDGAMANELFIYKGRNVGNTPFDSEDDIEMWADAIIYGKLKLDDQFLGDLFYEMDEGNYLVSYTAPYLYPIYKSVITGAGEINTYPESGAISGYPVSAEGIPAPGYLFKSLSVKNDSNGADIPLYDEKFFTMPESSVTITAEFERDETLYDITLNPTQHGTISVDPASPIQSLTSVTLTATPDANCLFVSWHIYMESLDYEFDIQENPFEFGMPQTDLVVSATFAPPITISFDAGPADNPTSIITHEGEDIILPGISEQFSCFAGWEFAGWSETEIVEATTSEPTILQVRDNYTAHSDKTLYAVFTRTTFGQRAMVDFSSGVFTPANGGSPAYITWTINNVVSILLEKGEAIFDIQEEKVTAPVLNDGNHVTITPDAYINSIEINVGDLTLANYLLYSKYENAFVVREGTKVIIAPEDNTSPISITIDGASYLGPTTVNYGLFTSYMSNPTCTVQLGTPEYFSAEEGNGQARFSWWGIPGASSYTIFQSTDNWETQTARYQIDDPYTTEYVGEGLTNGVTYHFKIRANGTGDYTDSELSEEITVTPTTTLPIQIGYSEYGTVKAYVGGEEVTRANAGETVTLVVTPNAGYELTRLTYSLPREPEVDITESKTFVMPNSEVFVSAYFTQIEYTVNCFSTNGSIRYNGQVVTEPFHAHLGDIILLIPEADEGYIFERLTYSDGTGLHDITQSRRFTMPASNVMVEATFRARATYTLTNTIEPGRHYIIAYVSGQAAHIMGAQNGDSRGSVAYTSNGSPLTTITETEGICELVIGGTAGHYTLYAKNEGYLYAASSSSNSLMTQTENDAFGEWAISFNENTTDIIAQGGNTHNTLRCEMYNGSFIFSCYAVEASNVCLFAKDNDTDLEIHGPMTIDEITLGDDETITIHGDGILYLEEFSGSGTIIIEDGGQLISDDDDVYAQVQTGITGYGRSNASGWSFIASPIAASIHAGRIPGLDLNHCDLYRFNQSADHEWENYKAHSDDDFYLNNGAGYLYANPTETTLEFLGTLNNTNGTVNLSYVSGHRFAGWNLIGNPFPCKTTLNRSYYILNERESRTLIPATGTEPINPCEGVFVYTDENDRERTAVFTKVEQTGGNGGGRRTLSIRATDAQARDGLTLDRAYVSFGEGQALPKFYFGEYEASLYIPQDDKEYAVVNAEGEGTLPLCFVAEKNGEYTLSFKAENVEADYLHLVDNLTGTNVDLLEMLKQVQHDGNRLPELISGTASYTFTAKTTDYASRFKLVFRTKHENGGDATLNNFAFISNGEIVISNEGEATLQVIDATGRVLSNQRISGDCRISTEGMTAGIYILNLNGVTQKIVVR